MHLLQVCNVGNICGGTAACAWTITRAFPGWTHSAWFLSTPTAETTAEFSHCAVRTVSRIDDACVRSTGADLLLLHNTARERVRLSDNIPCVTYLHSTGKQHRGHINLSCSNWLRERHWRDATVLYQPVPVPAAEGEARSRALDDELVIGRINTPHPRKWPAAIIPLYELLAASFPLVRWEFVGAPSALQLQLQGACHGRAAFLPADWSARRHLRRWHALLYHHPDLTESFGRTVAEAQRAGCVPIVDDRGGFREQIRSGDDGFLCRTPKDFESAVAELHNCGTRWRISQAARDGADKRCSLRTFAAEFANRLRVSR